MAHELYTRTNQKLYFAGLSLEAWRRAEAGEAVNAPALILAEREACLFHLYGALLGICHEVAGYYRFAEVNVPRVESILTPAVLAATPSPELAELVELAQQRETWLAQLLSAYAAMFQPPHAPSKAKIDPSLPLISSHNLDDEEEERLPRAELENWRQQLKVLALRFRETLSEC